MVRVTMAHFGVVGMALVLMILIIMVIIVIIMIPAILTPTAISLILIPTRISSVEKHMDQLMVSLICPTKMKAHSIRDRLSPRTGSIIRPITMVTVICMLNK